MVYNFVILNCSLKFHSALSMDALVVWASRGIVDLFPRSPDPSGLCRSCGGGAGLNKEWIWRIPRDQAARDPPAERSWHRCHYRAHYQVPYIVFLANKGHKWNSGPVVICSLHIEIYSIEILVNLFKGVRPQHTYVSFQPWVRLAKTFEARISK